MTVTAPQFALTSYFHFPQVAYTGQMGQALATNVTVESSVPAPVTATDELIIVPSPEFAATSYFQFPVVAWTGRMGQVLSDSTPYAAGESTDLASSIPAIKLYLGIDTLSQDETEKIIGSSNDLDAAIYRKYELHNNGHIVIQWLGVAAFTASLVSSLIVLFGQSSENLLWTTIPMVISAFRFLTDFARIELSSKPDIDETVIAEVIENEFIVLFGKAYRAYQLLQEPMTAEKYKSAFEQFQTHVKALKESAQLQELILSRPKRRIKHNSLATIFRLYRKEKVDDWTFNLEKRVFFATAAADVLEAVKPDNDQDA